MVQCALTTNNKLVTKILALLREYDFDVTALPLPTPWVVKFALKSVILQIQTTLKFFLRFLSRNMECGIEKLPSDRYNG